MLTSTAPDSACSEELLIRAAQDGQSWAWNRLVEAHQGMVYALARRWGQQQDADDIFQEVFLRVHKYLKGYRFESSIKTWIHRIAMNTLKDTGRRGQELAACEVQESRMEGASDSGRLGLDFFPAESLDLHQAMDDQARLRLVRDLFSRLSAMDREILILREMEDHSYEEIGERLGLELGTVKSRLFRARKALVQAMIKKGLVRP
jgi:RNA polymerase sigma-70 factor (ECF subfamily)